MGKPSSEIFDRRGDLTTVTVDNMNVDAFVYGVLSHQTEDLPSMPATTTFAETLAILMNSGIWTALHRDVFENRLASLISRDSPPVREAMKIGAM